MTHLDGLSVYPTTAGLDALRETDGAWFQRRYGLPRLDPATEVLPVNGTREALFAFAQAVVDSSRPSPLVVCRTRSTRSTKARRCSPARSRSS